MTRFNIQDSYRVMNLPIFPQISDDGVALNPRSTSLTPNELLGGFIVGPENRLAELATHFANEGVPVFDKPIGDRPIETITESNNQPSRADIEFLFRTISSPEKQNHHLADNVNILFNRERFNRYSVASNGPSIIDYRPLEEVAYLAPLVFYGPSGSGKTRLVEGICQRRRILHPRQTLYYLSASDFSQALNDAIRKDQTEIFKQFFSQAHAIAIENADILATRESAQREFIPMLDAAIKARKLVVMTFSKLPTTIPGLLPNLTSRISAGLLIPTNLPTRTTKEIVIDRVSKKLGLNFDRQILELCVERLPDSIGGLCATLTQMARQFFSFHTPVTQENVFEYLENRNPVQTWTIDRIVKTVAKYFSISIVDLRSKKRLKTLVLARKYIAFLARRLTNATLQEIGDQFSSRDHSTIVYSIKEIEDDLQHDEQTRHDLLEIAKALNAEKKLYL